MTLEPAPGPALTAAKGMTALPIRSRLSRDTADRIRVELHPGDYVTISASRFPFPNVLPQGRRSEDWVTAIRATLQWNSRQRQKSFKEWKEE
jgi:hypothetical protein